MKVVSQSHVGLKFLANRWLLLPIAAGFCVAAGAERVDSISQAKTLYVSAFSGGPAVVHLRNSFVKRLSKSRFRLVQSPQDADAIVTGSGQIWFRGFVSINARTPATDRQAVYAGYLSIEVTSADGQPLWSSLVTPGKLIWSNIVDDLAAHAAKKLVGAANAVSSPLRNPASPIALALTSLAGAGSTFSAPLYQKWFEDFEQFHPGVHLHYSPVGT
jgi:hypothetical protein